MSPWAYVFEVVCGILDGNGLGPLLSLGQGGGLGSMALLYSRV